MEISRDKSKLLVSSIKSRSYTNIRMNGKVPAEVDRLKYLGNTQNENQEWNIIKGRAVLTRQVIGDRNLGSGEANPEL